MLRNPLAQAPIPGVLLPIRLNMLRKREYPPLRRAYMLQNRRVSEQARRVRSRETVFSEHNLGIERLSEVRMLQSRRGERDVGVLLLQRRQPLRPLNSVRFLCFSAPQGRRDVAPGASPG